MKMKIRPSTIAGTWYSDRPAQLTHDLQTYLDQNQVQPPPGQVWGIVAPHACYHYSGRVAAYAFNCLVGLHPDLVVIISPLHQAYTAPLLTTAHQAYQTPLGMVEVDTLAIRALDQALRFRLDCSLTPVFYDTEHSVEIELPFLQYLLGEFQLLPIMLHDQSPALIETLGQALAETVQGQSVLFVASSDLSHFYPQERACKYDDRLLQQLEGFNPQGVLDVEAEGVGFACGRGAIAATLWATQALGANRVTVLNHATSGDVSGHLGAVVGYGAAVIWEQKSDQ